MKLQYHESLSAERRQQIECQGKDAMTQDRAKQVASRMRGRKGDSNRVMHYRCSSCGQWHVGSVPALLKGKRN